MRSYISYTGIGAAFGWGKRTAEGSICLTLGGLAPNETYALDGTTGISADSKGCWTGICGQAPMYITRMSVSGVALYDEARLTLEEARAILQPSRRLQKKEDRKTETVKTAKKEEAVQTTVDFEEEPAPYRPRSAEAPVDALVPLLWPDGTEKIRACFEENKPVSVLPLPWRFVAVPGTRETGFVGYCAAQGKVIRTAWAVRAKGGLFQPRALSGYRYVCGTDGTGYWMLIKAVDAAEGGCAR